MNNPKSYSIAEVLDSAEVDFTFNFYSSKNIEFMGKDLSQILGKQVVITTDESHGPTWTTSVLFEEYKAGRSKYSLKVGPQQYNLVRPHLRILLMWINENAALDAFSGMSVGLAFNHARLQTLTHISNMDVGKMILKVNEGWINERFAGSVNNPYSMSIKKLIPHSNFINASGLIHKLSNIFQLPMAEHYGVDFTDYHHGNLRFNYILGDDYSDKPNDIEEVLEYYVLTTYQVLNETDYTAFEEAELAKMTDNYLSLKNSWHDHRKFIRENKDLKIMVDLNANPDIIQTHWSRIRTTLFGILFENGPLEGKFNWDSEEGVFQIKDANIKGSTMAGIDLVNCTVNGCILDNIKFWATDIKNSRLSSSVLVSKNNVSNSVMSFIRADRLNKINESYIKNNGEIINCRVNDTIIRNAGLGKNAELDEGSVLIETRSFQPQMTAGIESPEIRDYKWIKSLRDEDYDDDKGYGNEFKTDY